MTRLEALATEGFTIPTVSTAATLGVSVWRKLIYSLIWQSVMWRPGKLRFLIGVKNPLPIGTATLLARGVIENTLRHIYFSDHPIEFARMNREKKWFLTVDALFEYPKNHPAFIETESKFDGINKASSLYSELSSDVHGRTVADLEMRTALTKIIYTDDLAKKHAANAERCASVCNFLLAVFHREKMAKFTTEDQRIILRSMPAKARDVCKG